MLYRIHIVMSGIWTHFSDDIGTDYIVSCKSNYNTITTTEAPSRLHLMAKSCLAFLVRNICIWFPWTLQWIRYNNTNFDILGEIKVRKMYYIDWFCFNFTMFYICIESGDHILSNYRDKITKYTYFNEF